MPQVILSLTAPKSGVRAVTLASSSNAEPIRHFIGGRFVPPALQAEYALHLPAFEADEDLVEVTGWGEISEEEARAALEEEDDDDEEYYDDEEGTQTTTPAKSETGLEEKLQSVDLASSKSA